MNQRCSISWITAATLWLCTSSVDAQTGYAGVWKAGPSRIAVTVHSWGPDCGPQPQSTTQPGGGTVEITEYGRNLAIHATDRTILTNACWSQNRAIARVSSSFLDGVWTTKCRTPPSDPKSEEGEYVLKVENNGTLQYRDSSNYSWELRSSRCIASIVTTQTLTRTTAAPTKTAATPPPQPAPVVEEPEAPEPKNCVPGTPARMVTRPRRVQIEPGQRTCVKAVVFDAAGCVVPQTDVRWTMQHSPALRGTLNGGCFEAASTAAEAEGEFKLIAQASGLRAEAVVGVASVDFSDLMAKRIETGAVSGHAATAPTAAQSQSAARVQARGTATSTPWGPLLVVGVGALLAIGGFGFWLRQRKAAPAAASAGASFPPAGPSQRPQPVRAPAAAPAPASTAVAATAPPSGETWICPTCRRGAPKEQVTCRCTPAGTPLIPYQEFAQRGRADDGASAATKLCTGCGKTCPAAAGFCGSCGKRF